MEYHGIFGHTLGIIQHIDLMSRIKICYTSYCLATQNMSPTLPGFRGINLCIQYLPYFILLILVMVQISSELNGVVIKFKTTQPRIV